MNLPATLAKTALKAPKAKSQVWWAVDMLAQRSKKSQARIVEEAGVSWEQLVYSSRYPMDGLPETRKDAKRRLVVLPRRETAREA